MSGVERWVSVCRCGVVWRKVSRVGGVVVVVLAVMVGDWRDVVVAVGERGDVDSWRPWGGYLGKAELWMK